MRYLLALGILAVAITACTFDPVRPQAVYEATATARAELALLPTTTPTAVPPAPTIEPEVVPPTPTPECVVRGNVTASGEKIYHVKGQANYNTVKPEECFANEESAVAAGYRKSLR